MASISYLDTGFGYSITIPSGSETYHWNGHSFNPSYTDQGITGDMSGWSAFSVHDATSTFDLTGFEIGNEVCLTGVIIDSPSGGSLTWDVEAVPARAYPLYTATIGCGSSSQWAGWCGVGIRYWEIRDDENHYVTNLSGVVSGSINWEVSNMYANPSYTPTSMGYIWVEGDYLHYINGYGFEQWCNHDGSSSFVGTDYAGSIWIDDTDGDYHIYYVDSSGNIRKTKQGSHYKNWYGYDTDLGNTSTSNAGYIWADTGDDHFLYWVAHDGNIVRTGSGYVYAGDTQ